MSEWKMTPKCPACRLRRRPGFMVAIVGARRMAIEDAPAQISWPIVCTVCDHYEPFGYVANPVPAPFPTIDRRLE